MTKISEIEGIGPTYSAKLAEAGVTTTEGLLEVAASPAGRTELAAATGLTTSQILDWCNRADLMRVKGVGEEYSDLLEAAGVDTCRELAQRRADNLHAKLAEVNESKKLVRRPPSLAEVEGWIANSKTLDHVLTY